MEGVPLICVRTVSSAPFANRAPGADAPGAIFIGTNHKRDMPFLSGTIYAAGITHEKIQLARISGMQATAGIFFHSPHRISIYALSAPGPKSSIKNF